MINRIFTVDGGERMIPVFFAPMEGVTDAVYRRVHHECFGGVDAYYIPFVSPTQNLVFNGREKHNVLPEHNRGVPCVPQILSKNPDQFLWAAGQLADMGYDEVNLNAGCPSGTVTAKGKGAGILRDPEGLDRFLDRVCAASPLPVSVKTRIGFESVGEWEKLLEIYARYPLKRLIVHPRTCRERYDPAFLHRECLKETAARFKGQLVVNGDLFEPGEVSRVLGELPEGSGVMLGRGLVARPALGRELRGGAGMDKAEIIHFHDRLTEEMEGFYRPDIEFMKLRVVMKHLACCFAETGKLEKKIRKARNLDELLAVDRELFADCALKEEPCFVPDD